MRTTSVATRSRRRKCQRKAKFRNPSWRRFLKRQVQFIIIYHLKFYTYHAYANTLQQALTEAESNVKDGEKLQLALSQVDALDVKGREVFSALKARFFPLESFNYTTSLLNLFYTFTHPRHAQEKVEVLKDEQRKVVKCKNLGQDTKGNYLTVTAIQILNFSILLNCKFNTIQFSH